MRLNAVRLMTVHGAKGLEFEAVHVPGLTRVDFPTAYRSSRCPSPAGMIEGTKETSLADEVRRDHQYEEKCLFFMALSRARTHLRLYHASRQREGNARSPSPFRDWLPATMVRAISNPPAPVFPARVLRQLIRVTCADDRALTDRHLASYEKCPRRFFYTHVMDLAEAARKSTAFARMQACIFELIRCLADARRYAEPYHAEMETVFEDIWKVQGPVKHALAAEYRKLTSQLIRALRLAGPGYRFRETQPLPIDLPNGRVLVEPNELADLPDGSVIIRRVRAATSGTMNTTVLSTHSASWLRKRISGAVQSFVLCTWATVPRRL